jgi:MFS family permease
MVRVLLGRRALSSPSVSRQYLHHLRTLSRNAKLYLVATVFQGLGSGVWGVLFYLYLKLPGVGFQDDFIGSMFTAGAIATGLVALPAGLLCERIGPKRAILIGILANLVNIAQITVLQPAGLLIASLVSGLIGTVSWVAAAPLLMENSRPEERTCLFSFQSTLSIIMSVVGSFIGGVMPNLFNSALGLSTGTSSSVLGHGGRGRLSHPRRALGLPTGLASSVLGYRISLAVAIAFSLFVGFPVLLMKRSADSDAHRMSDLLALKNIRSSKTIIKFMIPTAIIGFGAGFVVPLVNPFFLDRYKATSVEIGAISALGNVTLGMATLVVPILSRGFRRLRA